MLMQSICVVPPFERIENLKQAGIPSTAKHSNKKTIDIKAWKVKIFEQRILFSKMT